MNHKIVNMLLLTDMTYQALTVLLVGMTTVFFILLLVVLSGRALISVLNSTGFVFNKRPSSSTSSKKQSDISSLDQQVLEAAIKQWSKGKASIKEITKI